MAGTEYFTMDHGRLAVVNTNDNICVGEDAGNNTMTGGGNTFMGSLSGNALKTGYGNVGLGQSALQADTSGASNVAIGGNALHLLKTGNANISIGAASLESLDAGGDNVAIGYRAGGSATGTGNVFLGKYAGRFSHGDNRLYIENTDVDSTGALIYGEFDTNKLRFNGTVTTSGNLGISTPTANLDLSVGFANTGLQNDGSNNLQVFTQGVQRMFIGNKVGIGTGTPAYLLDVPSDVSQAIIAHFGQALVQNRGTLNFHILNDALNGDNVGFGQNSGGLTTIGSEDNDIVFYTDSAATVEVMRMKNNTGYLGIGTTAPGYKLQVGENGDGSQARANAWNTFSDRRWKTDLSVITGALDKIEAINGYYYKWIDRPDTTLQVGVIAQEIEAVLPEVVSTDAQGYKSVDYSKLTALLIQGMKEQQSEIELLQQEVKRIDQLESAVASLQLAMKASEARPAWPLANSQQ